MGGGRFHSWKPTFPFWKLYFSSFSLLLLLKSKIEIYINVNVMLKEPNSFKLKINLRETKLRKYSA